jgi:mycoredoxin-dependent peroxiredoxin
MLPVGSPTSVVRLHDQFGADVVVGGEEDLGDLDRPIAIRGPLVVVFFPAAFTSVCTGELRALRDDGLNSMGPHDDSLVAISCDSFLTLRAFADTEKIDYPLLSDFWPHGAAASAFDAFDADLGTARRTTYVIDHDGVVRWSQERGLGDARDIAEIRSVYTELIS